MIIDSSVWIDFFRGKASVATELLDQSLAEGLPQHICPPILQEVLQGIRDEKVFQQTKETLLSMYLLELNPFFAAEGAAKIYCSIRQKGFTATPNDCLIAFYAIHFRIQLVHNDSDFDEIARHTTLQIFTNRRRN
jgi:predicted nucleic acid-binding protein